MPAGNQNTEEDQDAVDLESMQADLEEGLASELGEPEESNEGDEQQLEAEKGPLEGSATPAAGPASADNAQGQPAQPAAQPIEAPSAWRPELKAKFAGLPPDVQAEIQRRESDISRYIGTVGPYAKVGEAAERFFEGHRDFLQQNNVNPWDKTVELWTRYRNFASANPEQRVHMLLQFAHENGLQFHVNGVQGVDPGVKRMQDEIQQLRAGYGNVANTIREQKLQEYDKQIEAFAADPKNMYFTEVSQDMVRLINSGQAANLQQAYELAIYANPTTRAKELARVSAAAVQEARKKANARTESARRSSGATIRPTPGRGKPASASDDWERDLGSTYDSVVGDSH